VYDVLQWLGDLVLYLLSGFIGVAVLVVFASIITAVFPNALNKKTEKP